MNFDEWVLQQRKKEEIARRSQYKHFDLKINFSDRVVKYVSNSENICHHGFYPFLFYLKKSNKFRKADTDKHCKLNWSKPKKREICYAAHIDTWIYKYYGFLLNEKYNYKLHVLGLEDIPIAYRTDKIGHSNINYAKEVFDKIKKFSLCNIIIGDFHNFFSTLDHEYLKIKLCELLEVHKLPEDYYKVFRSLTQYSYVNLDDVNKIRQMECSQAETNSMTILTKKQFRKLVRGKYKNEGIKVHVHQGYAGIPQGSPMSGVLANIYMLDIDKCLNDFVTARNGMYRRYSDDFIIIIPNESLESFREILSFLRNTFELKVNNKIKRLVELQDEKTKIYCKIENNINLVDSTAFTVKKEKTYIKFLGFSFNGNSVTIRDSTISRYYGRMYRKIRTICRHNGYVKSQKNGKFVKISCKKLYAQYSKKGAFGGKTRGNFLTYVARAKKIFGVNEAIDCATQRHMLKIRKALRKVNWEKPYK